MNKLNLFIMLFVALLASFVTQAIMAYSSSSESTTGDTNKKIYANGFVLLDKEGRERGWFKIDENGQPVLALRREDGSDFISLCVRDNMPYIALSDEEGTPRVSMGMTIKEYPYISVNYPNGSRAAVMELVRDVPSISVNDDAGKKAVEMTRDPENVIKILQTDGSYKIIR
ncbi:hypothetical protein AAU61_05625 [Desulfocarbo indianensis]|nr:hypothetical protein AAU61_05625 [Desulfocarbo indianensis]